MPIYDYKCTDPACGVVVEKITKSTTLDVECARCGASMNREVSGSQSFTFKGSGTYCEKSYSSIG